MKTILMSFGAIVLFFCGTSHVSAAASIQTADVYDEYRIGSGGSLFTALSGSSPTHAQLTTIGVEHPLITMFSEGSPIHRIIAISFGDSMADSYRSIGFCLIDELAQKYGIAGYAMNNYRNNTLPTIFNGAQWINMGYGTNVAQWGKYWFTDFAVVPPGGQLSWQKQYSSWGIYSDRQGLFMTKYPGGGDFTISISTNGDPYTVMLSTNGYSSDPDGEGCFIALDLAPNYYRLKIDGQTGTNLFIGPYIEDTQAPGIIATFIDKGGIGLDAVTNVSTKVRDPIFAALYGASGHTNTLLLWHMKEAVDASLLPRLASCNASWSNSMPGALVMYLGTPLMSLDTDYITTDTITVQHNTIVRSFAETYGRAYIDCMNPSIAYEWLVSRGFMTDGVHPTLEGSRYLLPIVWDSLGLFTGATHEIASFATQGDGTARIAYYASTNSTYTIQSNATTGVQTWFDVVGTAAVGNGDWRTNTVNMSGQQGFFRLRLTPP